VDSNVTKAQLRELLGTMGYVLVMSYLRDDNVKLKFDTEKRTVRITKDGRTHEIKFDDIEQVVNELA